MRYRSFLPHNHLILDSLLAAVRLTILGLSSSSLIQALADSVFVLGHKPASNWLGLGMLPVMSTRAGFRGLSAHLLAHLRRRIEAETASGYRRHLPGLPLSLFSLVMQFGVTCAAAILAVAVLIVHLSDVDVAVPNPSIVITGGAMPIVSEVSGRIEKIYVTEGSTVHLGDPILQLNTDRLLRRRNRLEFRIHAAELRATNDRAGLFDLYRELDEMQLNLGQLTVTSPADGYITSLALRSAGESLLAGVAIGIVHPVGQTSDRRE